MKQTILLLLAAATGLQAQAQTPLPQMEKLSRGIVAMHKSSGGNYVSWRLLGTDAENTTFDLVRNGQLVASGLTLTSYADVRGDGELELLVKWTTTAAKDNSEHGFTGSTILDCYRLNPATGRVRASRNGYGA